METVRRSCDVCNEMITEVCSMGVVNNKGTVYDQIQFRLFDGFGQEQGSNNNIYDLCSNCCQKIYSFLNNTEKELKGEKKKIGKLDKLRNAYKENPNM